MTSKKDIRSLISGIVGSSEIEERPRANERGEVTPELIEALEITPEMEEALNAQRRRKVGRPRKGSILDKRPGEARATFIVKSEQVRKIKYISLAQARLLKDVINEALSSYISKWEEANGEIKLPNNNNKL